MIVDDERRIAAIPVRRDKALSDGMQAHLKIHRRLRAKPAQNADCFHAEPPLVVACLRNVFIPRYDATLRTA